MTRSTRYAPKSLYRLYDKAGNLLYVGISANVEQRIKVHHYLKPWGKEIASRMVETFPSVDEAVMAEREAIARERPRYNVRRHPESSQAATINPVSVSFTVEQMELIQRSARTGGITMSEVIREAVSSYFGLDSGKRYVSPEFDMPKAESVA